MAAKFEAAVTAIHAVETAATELGKVLPRRSTRNKVAAAAAAAEIKAENKAVGEKKTRIMKLQKEMIDWIVANPEHEDCGCIFESDFGPDSFFHTHEVFREVDAGFKKVHDRELSIINLFKEKGYDVEIEVEVDDEV